MGFDSDKFGNHRPKFLILTKFLTNQFQQNSHPAEGRERAKPVYRYLILTNLYCLKKPKNLYFQRFSDFSSFLKRFNLHVETAEKLYFLYVLEQLFIFYLICRQEEKRTRYSISYASCFTSDVLLFTRPESGHVLVLWWDARWVPNLRTQLLCYGHCLTCPIDLTDSISCSYQYRIVNSG